MSLSFRLHFRLFAVISPSLVLSALLICNSTTCTIIHKQHFRTCCGMTEKVAYSNPLIFCDPLTVKREARSWLGRIDTVRENFKERPPVDWHGVKLHIYMTILHIYKPK